MLVIVTYDENGGLWDHVAPGRRQVGAGIAHSRHHRLALCPSRLRGPYGAGYDIHPEIPDRTFPPPSAGRADEYATVPYRPPPGTRWVT
ncbi:alkaline phosphatase family protein [Komagataeibacter rhaeticus]|nr:alkaline phosphatase family protein [Komagataeibacter rhaeticus]